jgi:hypothetical protein
MLRLCLDLNIWVAALLADRKGLTNTGSQYLVEIVRSGSSPVGAVNLIISLGMPGRTEIRHHRAFRLKHRNSRWICISDRRICKIGGTINIR